MNIVSYGQKNLPVIMLLHGGGLSWWNYKEIANILKEKYYVAIPILDGHAGSDNDFISIEENARRICQYIKVNFCGTVLAIGGLSLGAQILVEILSHETDICKYAFVESALTMPVPFTDKMIRPALDISFGLIKNRWFANLHMKKDLFEIYYEDTCKITKENMIAFLESNSSYRLKESLKNTKAKVFIIVGGKEQKKMQLSAQCLYETIQNSELIKLNRYYHGDLSINHAEEYVKLLKSHLNDKI